MIEQLKKIGVRECVYCPGKRNQAIITALVGDPHFTLYNHFEERSGAFFALGRARESGRPVAIVTTSGTAVGELLPAVMEAYYTRVPLVLITADRPAHFRGTGAPQACEQPGIFGLYSHPTVDLQGMEERDLSFWEKELPLHLNVCLEEVEKKIPQGKGRGSLVLVSSLKPSERGAVKRFLLRTKAPVYLEAVSGLREDPELQKWRVQSPSVEEVDFVLRIGGVPTHRIWRDLEERQDIEVVSVSATPFSGLSGRKVTVGIEEFLAKFEMEGGKPPLQVNYEELYSLFPRSEPALIHALSKRIPRDARVFLGNSLPIREWDAFASDQAPSDVWATRGLNGIDGQLSAFLGICSKEKENWGIFGDLTTLYDLGAPWVLKQMGECRVKFVVVNNGGGMIFSRVGCGEEMLSRHRIGFGPWKEMWGIDLLELIPDERETNKFYEEMRAARVPR